MKPEYNFTHGERGKFFRDNAQLNLPVYLEDEVRSFLQERAQAKGVDMSQLVNDILKQDIQLFETVK